jgi:hypothetical protein
MPEMPLDPFEVVMRIQDRRPDGRVIVELIPDDVSVKLEEGDEFLTALFKVDPFGGHDA